MIIVKQVEKAWSWLRAKMNRAPSPPDDGVGAKIVPPIPEPKSRKKSRYSVVLINESGSSRQIELTAFRLRVAAIAGVVAVVGLAILIFVGIGGSISDDDAVRAERDLLAAKVEALEEKLRQEQLAMTAREKGLEEPGESTPLEAVLPPSPTASSSPGAGDTVAAETEERDPIASLLKSGEESGARSRRSPTLHPGSTLTAELGKPSPAKPSAELETPRPRPPIVSFNAKDVTAVAEGANRGKLSFRLVKDHPKKRFSGYLFVFVEMEDPRGENKIYVYPRRTRLGDGDLPTDYRDGESLAFKFNSRVELPYGDIRMGASLARVSILLYGEDGGIVFQRGFSRNELKVVGSKATHVNGAQAKSVKRRQAL
jgi:hypothetical protein